MKFNLNGQWLFKKYSDSDFMVAEVPGTNFSDLQRLNKMPDPFRDLSDDSLRAVSEIALNDWVYKKEFTLSSDFLSGDKIFFVSKCIDTLGVLTVNGKEVTRLDNAFIGVRHDIKEFLVEGNNTIEINFCAPEAYVRATRKLSKTPRNNNGLTGIVHIRKPQYHFGWDFAPYLPVSGILDDVYLESVSVAEISDVRISQNHHYDGQVTLEISASIENFSNNDLSVFFSIASPSGEEFSAKATLLDKVYKADITIEKPDLWWTHDLSEKEEQPLYELITSVSFGDNIVAGKIQKFGIRKLELLTDIDEFGKNFAFVLNGVKIYCKGANYVSPDIQEPFNKERCRKTLLATLNANMNMLRVFGGSKYPDDFFFDECDRLGILVWQDFMFGCQGYPFFLPNFAKNCLTEIDYQVRRLRNHPCLAIWCGNNEIESMCAAWAYLPKYIDWADKFFYKILPPYMQAMDDRPYIHGSPIGIDYLIGQNSDNVGDSHIWNVWHGLMPTSYYKKRNPRFASEFGMESLPDIRTLEAFSNEPLDIRSKAFKRREFGANGLSKMRYYSLKNFNIPSSLSGWEYISEVSSAEGIRDAVSHFRAIKGRNNGCLIWQLNDMWPGISWSMIDYLGRFKAEMYYAKRLFAPLAVNIEVTDGGFYIRCFNDTNKAYNAHLAFNVCDYDGKVVFTRDCDVEIKPNESAEIMKVGMAIIREQHKHLDLYAEAILTADGTELAHDTRILRREKFARLPHPTISQNVERDGNNIKITLTSDKFARGVYIKNDLNLEAFSDNFFDLIPGRPYVVTLPVDDDITDNKTFEILDATSIEAGNFFTVSLVRLFERLRPLNAINHFASKHVPKDIKKRYISFFEEEHKKQENNK